MGERGHGMTILEKIAKAMQDRLLDKHVIMLDEDAVNLAFAALDRLEDEISALPLVAEYNIAPSCIGLLISAIRDEKI